MRKIVLIACAVFITAFSFAQSSAVTTSAVNLRVSPNVGNNILGVIPQGSEIEVKQCTGDWCEIVFGENQGYVSKTYIKATSPSQVRTGTATATSPVHYYTNVNGNKVQAPTQYTSQPAGATAVCRDGSYSFSQNHRGTCSHHGGVARWL